MPEPGPGRLNLSIQRLVGIAVLMGVVVPAAFGQGSAAQSAATSKTEKALVQGAAPPEFEVATIKPVKNPDPNNMHDRIEGRRFSTRNTTLRDLIVLAYELDPRQIAGGPAWFSTDEYDIDAVAGEGVQLEEQRQVMLQKLLADRFKLTFHREQREQSVYALVVAKSGGKLKASDPGGQRRSGCQHLGVCAFESEMLPEFAKWLGFFVLNKPVLDKTDLAGKFDFDLKWTPDESQFAGTGARVPQPADDLNAPPELFTALQEQLGLKLEPQKTTGEVLVIDHVDRPSEN